MKKSSLLPIAFALMILAQLYVPGKMIWDNERIWMQGSDHRFRTAPVDPNDVFRGKYIDLAFETTIVQVEDEDQWEWGDQVFGVLSTDEQGFSYVSSVRKDRPETGVPYLELIINYASDDGRNMVHVDFPFDRFYMEESKAYQAELSYNASAVDTASVTYALVSILDGEPVLKDVLIDGVPIKEVAEKSQLQTRP